MAKMPWFKMFASDYLDDHTLKLLPLDHQAVWMRLICVMHNCTRRGYLEGEDGLPFDFEQLALLCGVRESDLKRIIPRLLSSGSLKSKPNAVIFNRRMSEEGDLSEVRSKSGKKGGSKPKAKRKQSTGEVALSKMISKPLVLDLASQEGGSGGNEPIGGFDPTPEGCARAFFFFGGKMSSGQRNDEFECAEEFRDLQRVGYDIRVLLALVIDKDKRRQQKQYLWQFKKFLEETGVKPKTNGDYGKAERDLQAAAALEKAKRDQEYAAANPHNLTLSKKKKEMAPCEPQPDQSTLPPPASS